MEENDLNRLRGCRLFEGVDEAVLTDLLESRKCRLERYHAGAVVAFRGDEYLDLYIILEGTLSAEFQDYSGKILKVETLNPLEPIATAVLFSPDHVLPVSLIAETDVRLCSIPRTAVLTLMQGNLHFLENFLGDAGRRLTILAEKLRLIQFSTIREKIASYLLDQADKQGTDSIDLPVSKEALSEIFGVSRPSLSREFSRLYDEGVLSSEGKHIHILARETLEGVLKKE